MSDIISLAICTVLFLGSCVGCATIMASQDEQRIACKPVCKPYTVRYVDAKGVCVCDLTSILKEK